MYALQHGIDGFHDALLDAAWDQPVARLYRKAGLLTQTPAAMCGPTSIALVLRSMGIPARPTEVLAGSSVRTLFGARLGGMSLDQVAEVLQLRSGRAVSTSRDLSVDALRAELAQVNDPRRRYVANFTRVPLFGFGGGHHSPLGAFLPERDAVLVVDVNPRIGPWLVSVPKLHLALTTRDRAGGKSRGLARVELA